MTLVDFYGTSFIVFMLAIVEVIAVCWVYGMSKQFTTSNSQTLNISNDNATCSSIGVDRICRDIEFMMNRKTGLYWRLCWNLLMPLLLISILLYTFITYNQLKYDDKAFPSWAYGNLFKIQLGCQHIGDVCEQQK